MSALAHWLEEEGIATTLVALVRLHAEKMSPPRSLWVPFELGRPMGHPGATASQRRVLESALALLDSAVRPGTIEDFPDGAPSEADPQWRPPLRPGSGELLQEVALLEPAYQQAVARNGRTSVGLTGLDVPAIASYLAAYAADEAATRPRGGLSAASLMRFCADDITAYYLEAAATGAANPSSRQLADWFWADTVAARVIRRIRDGSAASQDKQRRALAEKSLIPGPYA